MTEALPWLLLVAALAAIPSSRAPITGQQAKPKDLIGPAVFAVLLVIAAMVFGVDESLRMGAYACAAGVLLGRLIALLPDKLGAGGNKAFTFGIGAALVSMMGFCPVAGPYGAIGLAAGLALATHSVAGLWSLVGVGAATVALTNGLGAKSDVAGAAHLGTAIALAGTLALMFQALIAGKVSKESGWMSTAAGALVVLGGAWMAVTTFAPMTDGLLLLGATLVVAVAARAASLGSSSSFASTLCTVTWLAGASVAFGLHKGLGMAVLLALGLLLLLLSGETTRIAATGPLAALVVYRLFREHFTEASRALDIGQHYAIVGLVVASLVPLAVVQWRTLATGEPNLKSRLGEGVALTLAGAAIGTAMVVLAAKGAIGLLVGFGLAPLVAMLARERAESVQAGALGWGMLSILLFAGLNPILDLAREDKVQFLLRASAVMLVLALSLAAMVPKDAAKDPS